MLRNKTIKNIIDDCDYYKNIIGAQTYFRPWIINPKKIYDNSGKKCWQLEEQKLRNDNNFIFNLSNNIFNYKNTITRKNRFAKKGITEYFNYSNKYYKKTIIILILILILSKIIL